MKIAIPDNPRPRIEMFPLIDVVFLLLVVFIYTMLSMAVHNGMPVSLPESSTCIPEKETILSVTIDQNGQIFVNRELTSLSRLSVVLNLHIKSDKNPGVLLFADKTVSYQSLFRVLDAIRLTGLNRISLQATSGQSHTE